MRDTPTLRHDEMHPDEDNVRLSELQNIEELAQSIAEVGVLSPLTINAETGIIIAGHRRHAAIGHLIDQGVWSKSQPIPVHFMDVAESATNNKIQMMLIENLQREDLSPVEEAKAIDKLRQVYDLKQKDIAERIGKSPTLVSQRLALLKLPEFFLAALEDGRLTLEMTQASVPLAKDEERLTRIINEADTITVSVIESLVERCKLDQAVATTIKRIQDAGGAAVRDYNELVALNVAIDHQSEQLVSPGKAELDDYVSDDQVYYVRGRFDGEVLVQGTTVVQPREAPTASNGENPSSQLDREAEVKAATRKRNAAIAELVSGRSFSAAEANAALHLFLVENVPEQAYKTAARLLGITEPPTKHYLGEEVEDWPAAVQEILEGNGAAARKAIVALVLVRFSNRHGTYNIPKDDSPLTQQLNAYGIFLDELGAPLVDDDEEGIEDD